METVKDLLGDPTAATPAMTDPIPFRVYQLNDYEWWMARSLEDAIADWCSVTGCTTEDCDDARELTDAELDSFRFFDEGVDESGNTITRTFREELARRVAAGETEPQLFATTET